MKEIKPVLGAELLWTTYTPAPKLTPKLGKQNIMLQKTQAADYTRPLGTVKGDGTLPSNPDFRHTSN